MEGKVGVQEQVGKEDGRTGRRREDGKIGLWKERWEEGGR